MLKVLGIPATIVIVRTENRGDFDTDPASLAPFDHAIAYVPSLDLYLDGTAEFTGSRELPAMDRNALALQVNEGHAKLVHLPDPPATESVATKKVEATIGADGSATIDWRTDVSGVSAGSWRARYHADSTRKQRVQQDLGAEFTGLVLDKIDVSDLEDLEKSVTLHAHGKSTQFARKEEGSLSVPVGPGEHMVREFAPLSSRKLDVRLYAQSTTENDWTVKLAPGAHVLSAPRPADLQSPFGRFVLTVESTPTGVHVKSSLAMTKLRIAVADYGALRSWCEQIDRALSQRLVVAPKG